MNVVACASFAPVHITLSLPYGEQKRHNPSSEGPGNQLRVNPTNFLTELKRRNVYRAAVACGVVAWFLTQLTTQVLPLFEIPNSAMRFVVIALAVGFPIAMLLWAGQRSTEVRRSPLRRRDHIAATEGVSLCALLIS